MEIRRVGAEFFHADKQTDEQNEMWLKMCIGLHVQYPLSLSSFKETCIFSTYFRKKNLKYEIFMKICRVGGRVFPCRQTNGRTDRHDVANSRFLQFGERPTLFVFLTVK